MCSYYSNDNSSSKQGWGIHPPAVCPIPLLLFRSQLQRHNAPPLSCVNRWKKAMVRIMSAQCKQQQENKRTRKNPNVFVIKRQPKRSLPKISSEIGSSTMAVNIILCVSLEIFRGLPVIVSNTLLFIWSTSGERCQKPSFVHFYIAFKQSLWFSDKTLMTVLSSSLIENKLDPERQWKSQ